MDMLDLVFFSICMDRCILKLVDECICIDEQVFFLLYMWIYGNLMNGCMCMYGYMDMIFMHNML